MNDSVCADPVDFYMRVHDKTTTCSTGFTVRRFKGAEGDADILKLIDSVYAPN